MIEERSTSSDHWPQDAVGQRAHMVTHGYTPAAAACRVADGTAESLHEIHHRPMTAPVREQS